MSRVMPEAISQVNTYVSGAFEPRGYGVRRGGARRVRATGFTSVWVVEVA